MRVVCPKCSANLCFDPGELSFREMTGTTFVEQERYHAEVLAYLNRETTPELFARARDAHDKGCTAKRIAKILECSIEDARIWMQARS